MNTIIDKDTHKPLLSPRQFPKLYDKVTHLHKDYLRALEALGRGWVNYHQWTGQCQAMGVKTHGGTPPERLSPTMIYGVFECRGYIEVQKDEKTKRNLYRLTDKGKGYLEGLLSHDLNKDQLGQLEMAEEANAQRLREERQLLPLRLLVFLTTSSLLFLGFVTTQSLFLHWVISIIGLVTCVAAFFHFKPIHRRIDCLEKELKIELPESAKRKLWERYFNGRALGWLWFPPLFGALWFCALLGTIFHWL